MLHVKNHVNIPMKNEDLNRLNTEPLPVEGHGVVSFELLGVLKKSLAT